jgi:hypothetical protein
MFVSKENLLFKKQEHLAHCFPVRIDLLFESSVPALGVSIWSLVLLAPTRPFQLS